MYGVLNAIFQPKCVLAEQTNYHERIDCVIVWSNLTLQDTTKNFGDLLCDSSHPLDCCLEIFCSLCFLPEVLFFYLVLNFEQSFKPFFNTHIFSRVIVLNVSLFVIDKIKFGAVFWRKNCNIFLKRQIYSIKLISVFLCKIFKWSFENVAIKSQ